MARKNRLFVALAPPPEIRDQLAALRPSLPGARVIPPENFHLTLRFVGEVDNPTMEEVAEALHRVREAPFELSLRGLGTFERRGKPSAIWAGVAPSDALAELRAKVDTALRFAGIEIDGERFRPHFTLARLRNVPSEALTAFLQMHEPVVSRAFRVAEFVLYSSFLTAEAPMYRAEERYPLDPFGDLAEEWEDGLGSAAGKVP